LTISRERELARIDLPRTSIYTTAMTCGVLAALGLQIHLNAAGFDFVGFWRNLFSTEALQLRTAWPWWGTAGLAFVVSGATAAALSRLPLPWSRFRLLRWAAGAAIVLILAHVGHSARTSEAASSGAEVAANLGAVAVATFMALCGAYLTARR
jgi:hypothetical protein